MLAGGGDAKAAITTQTRPRNQSIAVLAALDAQSGAVRGGHSPQRRHIDERRGATCAPTSITPRTATPASPPPGPFPVLMSLTPYGKKAPPPAAQIGGGSDAVSDQAGLHRGDGRRPGLRRLRRHLPDVRRAASPRRGRAGRLGVQAAQRQRAGRHVRGVLPGDQPAVHRRRCRAEFTAQGDLPGDGGARLLPRCGGDGRGAAPAHGARLRRGLQPAQRRQPGAGGDQSRQASAATRRWHRRCAQPRTCSARLLPAAGRRCRGRRRDGFRRRILGGRCDPRRCYRRSSRTRWRSSSSAAGTTPSSAALR